MNHPMANSSSGGGDGVNSLKHQFNSMRNNVGGSALQGPSLSVKNGQNIKTLTTKTGLMLTSLLIWIEALQVF